MNLDATGKFYFPQKEIVPAHSSEEVIVMHSEKMKAKYVKENV